MAERKATNKYYPPEWEPKHGSINTFRNSHALRDRAKKLKTEGILVIRFALPYSIWCNKCERLIGKGTRFNAEKQSVGKYYTLDIWQFTMKCASCSNDIVIRTDPEKADYVITSGAKKRTEEWIPEVDEVHRVMSAEESASIANDPMREQEIRCMDEQHFGKSSTIHATLNKLKTLQNSNWKNDYDNGADIRKKHRSLRKAVASEKKQFDKVYGNVSKDIKIQPSDPRDLEVAHQTTFRTLSRQLKAQQLKLNDSSDYKKRKIAKANRMINNLRQQNNKLQSTTASHCTDQHTLLDQMQVKPGKPPIAPNELIIPKNSSTSKKKQQAIPSNSLLSIAANYQE